MSWAFDEREMDGVQELNWGLPVTLVDLPGGQLAICAASNSGETVLLDCESLISWFRTHRPDLLNISCDG